MKSPLNTTFGLALALGIFANPAMAAFTMEYVNVLDPGNTADATSYGSVSTSYRIGKNEVTNAQYAEFLNAVASTNNDYGLYNSNMNSAASVGGITQTAIIGGFSYAAKPGMENRPVTYVSFLDAARFANWMHNGQKTAGNGGAASAESGAYTLNGMVITGISRSGGATVFLPSENEWYKAAYYDPNRNGIGSAGYWPYATQSASLSSNTIGVAGAANYTIGAAGNTGTGPGSSIEVTNVDAYGTNSDSAYGTNGQTGNVREITETVSSGTSRVSRGGSFNLTIASTLSSGATGRVSVAAATDSEFVGFRVAALIPEPSTALFTVLAVGASLVRRNRRSN